MPTNTTRGYPVPNLTGDGSDLHQMLSDLATAINTDVSAVEKRAPLAPVTSLPGSPTDGQTVLYQSAAMATEGIVWTLRYRAAATGSYKWEFVGGAPRQDTYDGDVSTASTSWAAPSGPTLTVQLSGVYELVWEGNAYAAGGALTSHFGLSINAADPNPGGESIVYHPAAGGEAEMGRTRRYSLASGDVLTFRHKVNANTGHWRYRRLLLTPVMVG